VRATPTLHSDSTGPRPLSRLDAPDPRDVADLLRGRATRHSRVPHDDGASIALVVEGGAMRGVISAGMVWALEDLGFTSAFDAVYGASAGAINAAYFLAGQAGVGTTIYFEDINNRSFIDLSRALRGRPIVNLGFLLDDVARNRKRLDTTRVLASATPLTVLATDVDSHAAVAFRGFSSPEQLFGALRAGATMPVVAGAPCRFDGRRLLDASLSEPIPLPTAEAGGHTHIVVLLTRSGAMQERPSAFDRYFVGPRLRRISPDLATRYLTRSGPYKTIVEAIEAGNGVSGHASVTGVRVEGLRVSKLECRHDVLSRAARQGYAAAMALFGIDSVSPQ
jgi:predicted patatin/cPLA2 family phospholipase